GSSPPALCAALAASADGALRALAPRASALAADDDTKLAAFRDLLDGELAGEKVLVFAEARETIEYLRLQLARLRGKRKGIAARVLDLLDEAVGVFREPVGGLDYVLESVESELTLLGARAADDEKIWERTLGRLAERVAAARAEVLRALDPLLDRRSCDLNAVSGLARRGARRLGVALAPGSEPEVALAVVAAH